MPIVKVYGSVLCNLKASYMPVPGMEKEINSKSLNL